MSKIFINYRRKDSAPYAGRLYDRLAGHFGRDHVFMDIDQIEPGEVFDQVIQEKLKAVRVAVVLIGEHWLDIADANGQRRLDHPDDWVRLEIAALLERNIRVIPVLVGGAAMPKSTQLPESLVPLTRRQAIEVTDHRFHTDVDKLIKALEKIMGVQTPPPPVRPDSPKPFTAIFGVIAILLAAFGLFHYFSKTAQENPGILSQPVASEPKESVVKQPMVEQSVETSFASVKESIMEQPEETELSSTKQPVAKRLKEDKASEKKKYVLEQPIQKIYFVEPEMVRVPPGKFRMGSLETELGRKSDESPQHEVTIAYAFEISKYEVTFDEYDTFANSTKRKLPRDSGWGRGKRPVINVSFNDAQAYVQWLSDKTDKQYRLPTEAEWEYAARAGTQTEYWWGNDISKNNAVCGDCASPWDKRQTAPVGSFKANAFGLYDTAGNVYEWVQDCWHDNYHGAPADGSAWLEQNSGDCNRRVVRGGSWGSDPWDLRSAGRFRDGADAAINFQGFRIARDF